MLMPFSLQEKKIKTKLCNWNNINFSNVYKYRKII